MKRRKKSKTVRIPLKTYHTIGVRFIYGRCADKVYTYRVKDQLQLYLGQELVARSDLGARVVVVVRLDQTPTDDDPKLEYKWINERVAPL